VLEGGNFLPQKHQNMLLNLVDLESITVDDIMVPRSQMRRSTSRRPSRTCAAKSAHPTTRASRSTRAASRT